MGSMSGREAKTPNRASDPRPNSLAGYYQPKQVFLRGVIDALAFSWSFIVGTWIRFDVDVWTAYLNLYLPCIVGGAIVFVFVNFVLGLYSPEGAKDSTSKRA